MPVMSAFFFINHFSNQTGTRNPALRATSHPLYALRSQPGPSVRLWAPSISQQPSCEIPRIGHKNGTPNFFPFRIEERPRMFIRPPAIRMIGWVKARHRDEVDAWAKQSEHN